MVLNIFQLLLQVVLSNCDLFYSFYIFIPLTLTSFNDNRLYLFHL